METKQINLFVLALVVVLLVMQFMHQRETLALQTDSRNEMRQLTQRITAVESELSRVKDSLDRLEQHSLGGVAKDATNTLSVGWAALMATVADEFQKAKLVVDAERQKEATPSK